MLTTTIFAFIVCRNWTPFYRQPSQCGGLPFTFFFQTPGKQHFYKQYQAEMWFEIITSQVSKGVKRKINILNNDLLGKEHHCYKIHRSLIKKSSPSPFYRQTSRFCKKILIPPFYDFSKISNLSPIYMGGSHYGNHYNCQLHLGCPYIW